MTSAKAKAVSEANELMNFHASARIDSDKRREVSEKKFAEMKEKFEEIEKRMEEKEVELQKANNSVNSIMADNLESQQKLIKTESDLWAEKESLKKLELSKGEVNEKLKEAREKLGKIAAAFELKEAEISKIKADTSEYKSNGVKMANSERAAERWKTAAAIAEKQALEEIEVAEGELKIALTHISKTEWKVKAVADENERLKEEIRVMKEGLEGDRIARSQHDAVLSKQQSLISYINQLSETGDLSMVDTSRMSCVNEIMLKIEQEEGGD